MPANQVFLSYIAEDSEAIDELQAALEAADFIVWRDKHRLWPGDDWQQQIRSAIRSGSFVFLACFSSRLAQREKSYQFEELTLAAEEYRTRPPGASWLMTARLDDCDIPEFDLGAGRTLGRTIHRVDLFGANKSAQLSRLIVAIQRSGRGGGGRLAVAAEVAPPGGSEILNSNPPAEEPTIERVSAGETLPPASRPKLSRLVWERANDQHGNEPIPAAKMRSYRRTIEYIELSAGKEVADLEIVATNKYHSNSDPTRHVPGTVTDEDWDDEEFFEAVAPVVDASAALLKLIGGWSDDAVGGAMLLRHRGRDRRITQSFDPPVSGTKHPWGSSNGMVHVRNWNLVRDIDRGYLDLWITASQDPYQIEYSQIDNSLDVLESFAKVEVEIREAMAELARTLLGDPRVHVAGGSASWDPDGMPVIGGDAYRFRYVITAR